MIIYEMTATFGKLDRQVLTLRPGLNVIHAPNEWGKSTWCAFLVAMLYGIDTRSKSTKTALADKERYAPWSGVPMEGRIDLNWNGRDITIERSTKGRIPFGVFRAYETATGLEVPELTASNCGQMLLGVEQSVFQRTGFLRLTDLPVTQDEALRRRLNALVTTGDESGAADRLAQQLRELKNSIRYNRSGKLPAAEGELASLEDTCRELEQLHRNMEVCNTRLAAEEVCLNELNNHMAALRYRAAQEDVRLVQAALSHQQAAQQKLQELESACANLPDRQTAEEKMEEVQQLQRQMMALQMESQQQPGMPEQPEMPEALRGIPEAQLFARVAEDQAEYIRLRQQAQKQPCWLWILPVLAVAAGVALGMWKQWLGLAAAAVLGGIALIMLVRYADRKKQNLERARKLAAAYHGWNIDDWFVNTESYVNQRRQYQQALGQYQANRGMLDRRYEQLRLKLQHLTGGDDPEDYLVRWQQALRTWDRKAMAEQEFQMAQQHYEHLRHMAKSAQKPLYPDDLTYSEEMTVRLIRETDARLRQLQSRAAAYRGRMEQIGDEAVLHRRMEELRQQIAKLEDMYAALEIAQNTLQDAVSELQRRFAPRIAARAQELFSRLTGGRYNRLNLTRDLAVDAAAVGETTLHEARWRSDGTVDQLYFALRLAVAEELTPRAPLVLDDALVRFDDDRLKMAMEILSDMAKTKQVILFTCHDRETRFRKPL